MRPTRSQHHITQLGHWRIRWQRLIHRSTVEQLDHPLRRRPRRKNDSRLQLGWSTQMQCRVLRRTLDQLRQRHCLVVVLSAQQHRRDIPSLEQRLDLRRISTEQKLDIRSKRQLERPLEPPWRARYHHPQPMLRQKPPQLELPISLERLEPHSQRRRRTFVRLIRFMPPSHHRANPNPLTRRQREIEIHALAFERAVGVAPRSRHQPHPVFGQVDRPTPRKLRLTMHRNSQ